MVYTDGTHLMADTSEELYEFAKLIGVYGDSQRFHLKARHKHYHLSYFQNKKAIKMGARVTDTRSLIKISQMNKQLQQQEP